ncbi:MAG: ABC transporter substrate-binding protein [Alphaproteobacteria bacterium]|nr:ABC transporter substrate-binding protein [Alphaproteobacteria bacterium]
MKKTIIGLCVVALIAVFGGRAWYLQSQKKTEKIDKVIKIGAVLPMSGALSDDGSMTQKALTEAFNEFNQSSDFKVKLVVEDGKFTAKDSISAFRKLQSDNINIVFIYGDVPAIAIQPISKEQNLPIYANALKTLDLGVNFFPDTSYLIDYSSDFVMNDLNAKSASILYLKGIETEFMAKHFEDRLAEKNIPVLRKDSFAIDATDARSLITKILEPNPEVVAIFGWGALYPKLINTLREQGFTGPIITDWNITTYTNVIGTKHPLYWTDTRFDFNSDDVELRNFVKRFEKKYQRSPSSFSMMNYIAAKIIASSIKKYDYDVQEVYKNILNTRDFSSVLGPISIGENNHMRVPLVIKQMQADGTIKIIKK